MGWEAQRKAMIIGVIRGEIALAALACTDLVASPIGMHPPCHQHADVTLQVRIEDLARGLVAYHARPEERYDWVWALLSWDFIEIAEFARWREPDSAGGVVLAALWNAAYRLPTDADTERTVAQIAAGSCVIAACPT